MSTLPAFASFLPVHFSRTPHTRSAQPSPSSSQQFLLPRASADPADPLTYDVVVVGSGLGGLSAAALLSASYNRSVCVLEAHSVPGGAAHCFSRRTPRGLFTFETGPHLFSGLSSSGVAASTDITPVPSHVAPSPPSANPMQHVLRAVDAHVPIIPYKRWGVFLPDGVYVPTTVSPSQPLFSALVSQVAGPNAAAEVANLLDAMLPLCKASTALPPAALRSGDIVGSLRVASRFLARPDLLSTIPHVSELTAPFAPILHRYVKDPFARDFLNLLCFLLAGVTAEKIPTAEVAFMFAEWTGSTAGSAHSDSVLEHPIGGAAGIVDELVAAVERSPRSAMRTNAPVAQILLDTDGGRSSSDRRRRAVGVQLRSGEQIYARQGVISNVSGWDLPLLLSESSKAVVDSLPKMPPMCPSFMHLNVAIELTPEVLSKLPYPLEVNYACIEDWNRGVDSPDNVVLVTIPSLVDDSCGPSGFAVIHAYTPATEPFEPWAGLEPGTEQYESFKETRSKILWRALSRIFGQDVEDIAHIKLVGTPKTHARFLRRKNGTYGPAVDASNSFFALPFPHRSETADGLWTVGDSAFPGIGVPATAASGWLAANAIVSVDEHIALLHKIGL